MLRFWVAEEEAAKENEKEQPRQKKENQENEMLWNPSEESIL